MMPDTARTPAKTRAARMRVRLMVRRLSGIINPSNVESSCKLPFGRMQQTDSLPALTQLSQDEALFRDSVYEFADREIRPLVRKMDEHAKIPPDLLPRLFDLGVMGIEIPEAFGGAGATFFH